MQYLVRLAVRVDYERASVMFKRLLTEDPDADAASSDSDRTTFWTRVDAIALETAVEVAVERLRRAAHDGQTRPMWPEDVQPESVEAYPEFESDLRGQQAELRVS